MPNCQLCDGISLSSPVCNLCLKTRHYKDYAQLLSAKPSSAKAVELTLTTQPASKVQSSSDSGLYENVADWVGPMIEYLNGRGYWNSAAATNVGDQHTPPGCEVGTRSLDFQGVRAGAGGKLFWIDLQAQMGGGSSKRKSYGQVLIQTRLGVDVPAPTIVAALRASLKGTHGKGQQQSGVRIVIHDKDATDFPPGGSS